jgi:hypothetical protein
MNEYKFQYTKIFQTLLVILSCIAAFMLLTFIGIYLSIQEYLTIIIALGLAIYLHYKLKGIAVHNCIAKMSDVSVIFEFENDISRTINFSDLTSYKVYYGKNGPMLYLRNNVDNFKISANNNYCRTDAFVTFCEAIIAQLDKYKNERNPSLVHEGSIFTKPRALYFLLAATLIYVISFFAESKALRISVGVGGGFYLFFMWMKYFIEKNRKLN